MFETTTCRRKDEEHADYCKRSGITKVMKKYKNRLFIEEHTPSKLIFAFLYYYFIVYVYFTCVTSCIGDSCSFPSKLIYRAYIEKTLLANIELKFLLGYFNLILISFVIRKSIHKPSLVCMWFL